MKTYQENRPLLSLCIPTNGKLEFVLPLLESIYSQSVDNTLFEVVITDNGDSDALLVELRNFNYSNLHYYKTSSKGFTNQLDSFEKSTGQFCKFVNHRTILKQGSIKSIIDVVNKYKNEKPIIYFSDGRLRGFETRICSNLDETIDILQIRTTWSAGCSAWREDIPNIKNTKIDQLFPHMIFLYGLRHDSKYVIWNKEIDTFQDNINGGYNFFEAFSVRFIDLMNDYRRKKIISDKTFVRIKQSVLNFLSGYYLSYKILKNKNTYSWGNIKDDFSIYYGKCDYYYMIFLSIIKMPKVLSYSILKHLGLLR